MSHDDFLPPLVSTSRLKSMSIGDIVVFRELESVKNAGASAQSYAIRAKIKIKTLSCVLVYNGRTVKAVKCVTVARIE